MASSWVVQRKVACNTQSSGRTAAACHREVAADPVGSYSLRTAAYKALVEPFECAAYVVYLG